ncbi:ClpP/crotonase [Macrolepiota fuliginosa MF-IS2]|uniref:ClpP/crotonase n=1 Tax=Macrolepiota fuliginosa MF-IS2 TaxID=1400762 RepID=A0A9P6C6P7_9AGAR|nr:ClpP/crotonase [Macrolepiota fuliginosa MF-IS2]
MNNITVNIERGFATIQLNRPATLNALTPQDYDDLTKALREINEREDVTVTILQGTGKWFCAGTSVRSKSPEKALESIGDIRKALVNNVALTTLDCSKALYSHRKILVAALNGPVMGITAALLGLFDFIYAMPNVWMSTPFTFLGIVAEGGASASFVNRMGVAKANEMLIWGKKKEAQELLECGFINKIFPQQPVESFHKRVRQLLEAELEGLDPTAVLSAKKLIKAGLNDKNDFDAINLRESYAQAERFASGVPFRQFSRIANKEIRHKL